jgi:hypothetical protein
MSALGVTAAILTAPLPTQNGYCCGSLDLVLIKGFIETKAFGVKYSIMTL